MSEISSSKLASAQSELAKSFSGSSRASRIFIVLFLCVLWGVLIRYLSAEWSNNEQYNYGWFVPFFSAYLFWIRWEKRPQSASPLQSKRFRVSLVLGLTTLFFLLPIRLLEIANPDWRLLAWVHTGLVVALTFLIIWRAGRKTWLSHFAFPIAFFCVAVPWPFAIEVPIIQGLMHLVASVAAEILALFGIPTQLEGNLIRVSTGVVGVNEACSGVRSLQTSLMIGLLLGELERLSVLRRAVLVLGALLIALLGNFGRAFFLVWLAATRGLSATEGWHDLAGYSILGTVFVGSLLLAKKLGPQRSEETASTSSVENRGSPHPAESLLFPKKLLPALCWLLLVELMVEGWYRSHEEKMEPGMKWTDAWPQAASGFHDIPIADEIKRALRFDRGREAVWSAIDPDGSPTAAQWIMFFFRWEPGTSSILLARAHRPDVCLPTTGWREMSEAPLRNYPVTEKFALPFRHYSFVRKVESQSKLYAHAFFCLREDAVGVKNKNAGVFALKSEIPGPWVRADRVNAVLEGLRNPGQQVIELILITPEAIQPAEAEKRFAELLPSLVRVGEDR
jgi:exosortase